MIGSWTAVKASAARIGLWLSRWTPSRRLLAEKPISRSAGRWVSLLRIPKSPVSLIWGLDATGSTVTEARAVIRSRPGSRLTPDRK
jgi:hypothetical protein